METFFFIFSMLLVLACMLAASVSLCAFLVTRRSTFVTWVCAFSAYLLESGLVLFEEYLPHETGVGVPMTDPGLVENVGIKLALSAALVFSFWLFICKVYDWDAATRRYAVPTAVVLLQVASSVAAFDFDSGNVGFYLIRDAYLLACSAGLLVASWKSQSVRLRGELGKARGIIVVCIVLLMAALLMDLTSLDFLFDILWANRVTSSHDTLYYYLVRRNVFEISFVLVCVAMAIGYGARVLDLRFSSAQPLKEISAGSREVRLERFGSHYGLSDREREIMVYILDGASYQRIASDLVISLGTVKAHASHIYAKTGTGGRAELLQAFWRE